MRALIALLTISLVGSVLLGLADASLWFLPIGPAVSGWAVFVWSFGLLPRAPRLAHAINVHFPEYQGFRGAPAPNLPCALDQQGAPPRRVPSDLRLAALLGCGVAITVAGILDAEAGRRDLFVANASGSTDTLRIRVDGKDVTQEIVGARDLPLSRATLTLGEHTLEAVASSGEVVDRWKHIVTYAEPSSVRLVRKATDMCIATKTVSYGPPSRLDTPEPRMVIKQQTTIPFDVVNDFRDPPTRAERGSTRTFLRAFQCCVGDLDCGQLERCEEGVCWSQAANESPLVYGKRGSTTLTPRALGTTQ